MTLARITAILLVVLMVIRPGFPKPTIESTAVKVSSNASTNDPQDQEIQGDIDVGRQPLIWSSATDGDGDNLTEELASANKEYEVLLGGLDYEYDKESLSKDEDGKDNQTGKETLLRSGNLILSPTNYQGSNSVSQISGFSSDQLAQGISGSGYYTNSNQNYFPPAQQQSVISQTLNPAYKVPQTSGYYTNSNQNYLPPAQQQSVISQIPNPAYKVPQNSGDYSRGRESVAKLMYLIGLLSKAGGSGIYAQQGLSGILQGGSSDKYYGQNTIQQPSIPVGYGTLGGSNSALYQPSSGSSSAISGSSSAISGSSSAISGSSLFGQGYLSASDLSGQSFIKLIQPITRFVAIQTTSPREHWSKFLENINQEQVSGSKAYKIINEQINHESQRQQRLIHLLKYYKQIAERRVVCT